MYKVLLPRKKIFPSNVNKINIIRRVTCIYYYIYIGGRHKHKNILKFIYTLSSSSMMWCEYSVRSKRNIKRNDYQTVSTILLFSILFYFIFYYVSTKKYIKINDFAPLKEEKSDITFFCQHHITQCLICCRNLEHICWSCLTFAGPKRRKGSLNLNSKRTEINRLLWCRIRREVYWFRFVLNYRKLIVPTFQHYEWSSLGIQAINANFIQQTTAHEATRVFNMFAQSNLNLKQTRFEWDEHGMTDKAKWIRKKSRFIGLTLFLKTLIFLHTYRTFETESISIN